MTGQSRRVESVARKRLKSPACNREIAHVLRSFLLSKQTENEFDGDAHAPNDGLPPKSPGPLVMRLIRVSSIGFYFRVRSSENSVRQDIVDSKRFVGHAIEAHLAIRI